MRYLNLILLLPITALAIDPTLPVVRVSGESVVDQRGSLPIRYTDADGNVTVNYHAAGYRWESDGWRQWVQASCGDGDIVTNRTWDITSTTATEVVECGPSPVDIIPPAYERLDVQLAATWPLLTDHPSTNDIPAGGMTYRLDGDPITWWIVRQSDVIATQLSAHDDQGREIVRSRNLATGAERTIDLTAVDSFATTNTVNVLRTDLRTIKTNLQGVVYADFPPAERDDIRLIVDEVQELRKVVRDLVKGTD